MWNVIQDLHFIIYVKIAQSETIPLMDFILQFEFVADEDDKLDIARLMKKEHVLFLGEITRN